MVAQYRLPASGFRPTREAAHEEHVAELAATRVLPPEQPTWCSLTGTCHGRELRATWAPVRASPAPPPILQRARGQPSPDPRGESRTGPTRRDARAQGKSRRKERGFPRADLRAGGPGFRALLSHARNPWPAAAKRPDERSTEIRADEGPRFPRPAGGGPVRDSPRESGDDRPLLHQLRDLVLHGCAPDVVALRHRVQVVGTERVR